jgi:hypothetical protein
MDNKSNFNLYTNVIGTDLHSIKSDYAPVINEVGYPTLSKVRCCENDNFGNLKSLLRTEPMTISGYGLPIYSDNNKCGTLLRDEEKKSLNNDKREQKEQKKQKYSKRNANLGENVLSYRIINRKEKK